MPGKILSGVAAVLALVVASGTASAQPGPAPRSANPAQLERGRYLVEIAAFCGACHTTRAPDGRLLPGMELAGGRELRGARVPRRRAEHHPGSGDRRRPLDRHGARRRHSRRPAARRIADRPAHARGVLPRDLGPRPHRHGGLPAHGPAGAPRRDGAVALPIRADAAREAGRRRAGPAGGRPGEARRVPGGEHRPLHGLPLRAALGGAARPGAPGLVLEGPWGAVQARNISSHPERGIGRWTDEQVLRAITQGVSADGGGWRRRWAAARRSGRG
jgi:hypothetical protein